MNTHTNKLDIESLFAVSCLHPFKKFNIYFFLGDMTTSTRYMENVDGIKAIEFIERIFGSLGDFEVILTSNRDDGFECVRPDFDYNEIAGVAVRRIT